MLRDAVGRDRWPGTGYDRGMMIAWFPLLLIVLGILVWKLTTTWSEAGKIMFFCGLLVLTYALRNWTVHLG